MDSAITPWGGPTQFFYALSPDVIDQVLRTHGLRPLGRVLALNSLENRVYEVEVSRPELPPGPFSPDSVVVKFYRPGRWSEATLREEHQFLRELGEYEIPVVAPLERDQETLFRHDETGLFYTVFPKVRGRLKDELTESEARQIGRLIARLQNVGALSSFSARPKFGADAWLLGSLAELESFQLVPASLLAHYATLVRQLHAMLTPHLAALPTQRIHGDFHRGNILWTQEGPWITDLDDCVQGPREQDLWLLFSGRDEWSLEMRAKFLEGYHEMSRDRAALTPFFVETLRTLRLVHFNGWIAKRYADPTFARTFEAFASQTYWEQQLLDLKEQIGLLQDLYDSPS